MLIALICLLLPERAKAQQEEVLLTFHHPAIGSVYVNSLYNTKTDEIFLPVIELFSLLEINYIPEVRNFSIKGNFIKVDNPYIINLSTLQVQLGKNTYPLKSEDFHIGDLEYYLSPRVFEEIFGLNFTVNIDQLVINLETTHTLPVQERKDRELTRKRMESLGNEKVDFPMGYDRKRSTLTGTMIDYSIIGNYSKEAQNFGYTFTGGMEALGGDIQGTVNGSNSSDGYHSLDVDGLRWRYAIRDNDLISGIMAGQTSTTGLLPLNIKGLSLTNDPIEPRQLYETYVVDGTTEPESEVELYVNERLSDFKRADELGYYRFNVPITYGTTRISLHIYTPSGQLLITDKEMQVPFTFLPRGVASYNVQAGKTENYLVDSLGDQWVTHGNVAMGLTKWLTASAGTQFLGNSYDSDNIMAYGSFSARVAKQYLINVDAAPNYFYRLTGSVLYANNINLNLIYTRFDGQSILNSRNASNNLSANVYLPFKLFGTNYGLRINGEQTNLINSSYTTFRTDLNTRVGKVDLRLNYRDYLVTTNQNTNAVQGMFTTALTYTISRSPGIPVYIRGMYLRAQTQYDVQKSKFLDTELNLSRTVWKTGRLDMGVFYDHFSKAINSRVGLTLDLNAFRSVTTAYTSGKNISARQSLTGSIGWDMPNDHVSTSNRQQVGRSAAAVLMFVDNNNSGHYDNGDQLLPYRGVKVDRTSTMVIGNDSILRLTQLQSYYKYNLSVNRNAIPDPTLVPINDNFSFIADPNQYKQIEIPFYRGGTIEGTIFINRDGNVTGQGGLSLYLKSVEGTYETVVRTMSDGGYFIMDLAPGKYTLEVDSVQLGFLNVRKNLGKISFEIKALAEGDYLNGLNINLIPDKVYNSEEALVDETIQAVEIPEYDLIINSLGVLKRYIPFGFYSKVIHPDHLESLRQLADYLRKNSSICIEIQGHTDETGSKRYNQALSEKRAKSVMRFLASCGVQKNRMRIRGFGETKPLNRNLKLADHAANRRVTFERIK